MYPTNMVLNVLAWNKLKRTHQTNVMQTTAECQTLSLESWINVLFIAVPDCD